MAGQRSAQRGPSRDAPQKRVLLPPVTAALPVCAVAQLLWKKLTVNLPWPVIPLRLRTPTNDRRERVYVQREIDGAPKHILGSRLLSYPARFPLLVRRAPGCRRGASPCFSTGRRLRRTGFRSEPPTSSEASRHRGQLQVLFMISFDDKLARVRPNSGRRRSERACCLQGRRAERARQLNHRRTLEEAWLKLGIRKVFWCSFSFSLPPIAEHTDRDWFVPDRTDAIACHCCARCPGDTPPLPALAEPAFVLNCPQ